MENPWAPFEEGWRRKKLKGEPTDFTVDTPDKAMFEREGEEWKEKYKIEKHLAPLLHQGDYANCTTLFLLGHMQSPGYDLLSPEFTPEKLDLYFSNLLQRPLQGGEPIRGLSTSFGRGWWINQKLKHILKDLDEMFGKTPEEALRIVQEMIAIQQVHSYAMSVAATGAQFEPAALERTMGYSLSLAKQAIERGVLVVVLARWSHWDKVLDLSGRPDLKVIRFKKKATQRRIPNISEKVIDPETSNANYNDLLNALGGVPTANPPSPSTKRRSKPVATPGTPAKSEAREGQKGRQTNAEAPRSTFVDLTMGVTLPKSSETARAARGMRREATAGPSAGGQAPPADAGATVHSPPPDIGNAPGLIAAPEPNTERQGVTVGGPRTPEREGPDGLGETKKVVSLKELYRRSSNVTADALLDARSDDSEAEDGPGPVAKKQKVSVDGPPTPARDGPEMKAEGFETNCQAVEVTAAAAAAAEKRAKAEAEEGPRLANVGAAPIAAKEEVSERKPSILEEAIESAVREQLAAERERLAAEREQLAAERKEMKEEHAKQEKLWLNRSAQLEAALAKPEKDLG